MLFVRLQEDKSNGLGSPDREKGDVHKITNFYIYSLLFPCRAGESHPPYPLPARAKSINPRSISLIPPSARRSPKRYGGVGDPPSPPWGEGKSGGAECERKKSEELKLSLPGEHQEFWAERGRSYRTCLRNADLPKK